MLPLGDYQFDEIDASGRFRYDGRRPARLELRAATEDGREGELAVDVSEGDEVRDLRIEVAPPWRSHLKLRALVGTGRPRDPRFRSGEARVEWLGDVATLLFRDPPGTSVSVEGYENTRGGEDGRSAGHVLSTAPMTDLAVVDVLLPELVPVRLETDPPAAKARAEFSNGFISESAQGDGSCRLSPARSYSVKVSAKGFVPVEIVDWRPPPGGGPLKVQMRPAGAIRGVVIDSEGGPVAGALVHVGDAESSAKTGPDGSFVLHSVPEGEHVVIARLKYKRLCAVRVRTERGATSDVGTLVAEPRRTIQGRVMDEVGRPVGGVRVEFVSVLRSERYPESDSDSTGTYTHADGCYGFDVPGVEGFLLAVKKGYGTTPAPLGRHDIVLPRPAFLQVDATRAAKEAGVSWTCCVRWPDIVPEAVWDVGMFLPHTVEVAPGRVEIIGEFDQYRLDDLKSPIAGSRTRTIEVAQGENGRGDLRPLITRPVTAPRRPRGSCGARRPRGRRRPASAPGRPSSSR